jgi:argininosuccinate lyase
VLAALRLYLRDAVDQLASTVPTRVARARRARPRQGDVALPGYTHMQPAMPSSVALWAGGYAAELRDDAEALRQRAFDVLKNPLGSAAGYGTPNLPIDRERPARGSASAESTRP